MRAPFILIIVACSTIGSLQGQSPLDVARQLARDATRQAAVSKIVAAGSNAVPLLISLAEKPPTEVNEYELSIGLAEAFGRLKTRDAIPFLMTHIKLQRGLASPNTWLKTAEIIQQRMPAVAALIQIGPEASKALMDGWERMGNEDRLPAIFVISQISGVPEARAFLSSVLGEANMERYWAERALKLLDSRQQRGN